MRFSPRDGDATIFKKIASPSQAKNRSCSRSLSPNIKLQFLLTVLDTFLGVQLWTICLRIETSYRR